MGTYVLVGQEADTFGPSMLGLFVGCASLSRFKARKGLSEKSLPVQEYDSFRISNDGSLEGVGLMIASDPSTGSVVSGLCQEEDKCSNNLQSVSTNASEERAW